MTGAWPVLSAVGRLALFFLAGILLNMSLLHYLAFMETRTHPFVPRSRSPHLTSALWATLQLGLALTRGSIPVRFGSEPGPAVTLCA